MILAMTAGAKKNLFVKIQIGLSGKTPPRELGLTRLQFEIFIFLLPVVFLWGLGSTAILIKTLYFDRPNPTYLSDSSKTIVNETVPLPTIVADELIVNENSPSQLTQKPTDHSQKNLEKAATPTQPKQTEVSASIVASRSFKVDDIFNVDFSVARNRAKNSYYATLAMTNLKSKTESGRYWFSVLALTKTNKWVWLTSMPEVRINASGQAQDPKRGRLYSFQNFRKSELELPKYSSDIVRFEKVIIGFERDNNTPAIAKVQLMSK
jgi:hypothetical protein